MKNTVVERFSIVGTRSNDPVAFVSRINSHLFLTNLHINTAPHHHHHASGKEGFKEFGAFSGNGGDAESEHDAEEPERGVQLHHGDGNPGPD